MTLFVGKFKACTDTTIVAGSPLIEKVDGCMGTWVDSNSGILVPRVWEQYDRSFDNIFSSIATLFDVSSLDDWSTVMYHAVDIHKKDYNPIPGHSWFYCLFFVMFVFFSSLFVFQMFVAVVVDSFYHVHGFFELKDSQSQLRNLTHLLKMSQPAPLPPAPPPVEESWSSAHKCYQRARMWVWELVALPSTESAHNYKRAKLYDRLLTAALGLNVAMLMTLHHPSSDEFNTFYNAQNLVFLFIFWVEAGLKLFALGRDYFKDAWNWLDIVILFGSTVAETNIFDSRMARFLRILRVFRLIRKFPEVEALISCMLRCAVKVIHVVIALLIFYYISVFGDLMNHLNLPLLQKCTNVYCDGVYDLCHVGHKNLFRKALSYGNRLIVGVVGDKDAKEYKRPPVMTAAEREAEVGSCKCVTKVVPNSPCFGLTKEFIEKHKIHKVAFGQEYVDRYPDPADDPYYKVPRQMGIGIPLPRTPGLSTSDLIKRIQDRGTDERKADAAPLTQSAAKRRRVEGADNAGGSSGAADATME